MLEICYSGCNAYQQCPNDDRGSVLPTILENWKQFILKTGFDIQCTHRTVVIKADVNFLVYGLLSENCEDNYRTIAFPFPPQSFIATDDFLVISKGNRLRRSWYENQWSEINFSNVNSEDLELWEHREIVLMSYTIAKSELVMIINDGSVWKLSSFNKLMLVFSPNVEKAIHVASGFEHTLILTESGCVLSFGNGSHGQLGHGDLNPISEPLQILALKGLKVVKIAAGGWHSCAVTDSGDLYMWGWNNFGQMSEIKENDTDAYGLTALPVLFDIDLNKEIIVRDVACGTRHTFITTDHGDLFATGWNEYGQLGIRNRSVKKINKFVKVEKPLGKKNWRMICGAWSTILYARDEIT